jgi:DNA/RNA-binding domain of Phe-tRNA-synthetase-like protein
MNPEDLQGPEDPWHNSPMMRIRNALADDLDIAAFSIEGAVVVERSDDLAAAVAGRGEQLRRDYATPSAAAEVLADARELYRSVGIDPTKRRPSSEALTRRMIQGKGLYTVNAAVDAANLTCLHHFLPVGLYDTDRIESSTGLLTLRLGRLDEGYPGIGKGRIHLEGRPALVDDAGPFGNPSADSFRTRITLETTRLLYVLFCPGERGEDWRRQRLEVSKELMLRFVGGRAVDIQ